MRMPPKAPHHGMDRNANPFDPDSLLQGELHQTTRASKIIHYEKY